MPNSRRRRFSVQRNIIQCNANKVQNRSHSSDQSTPENDQKVKTPQQQPSQTPKPSKAKNKPIPVTSKLVTAMDAVVECDSTSALLTQTALVDKDVTASSSNIDLFNILTDNSSALIDESENVETRDARPPNRHDKYLRQHRVKVRSPKRRMDISEYKGDPERATIGLNAIDWDQEVEEYIEGHETVPATENAVEERVSNHSLDDMCRICHGGEALSPELGPMISACACRGTVGRVHVKCLERWLTESGKSRCELCGTRYATRRVHRYGLPKAFVMWILSQNAKQLMVDSLGIMLMSPLAVLAAWLSGRTLAGLMTPESHVTPWPLASTFVLACMTLVCYYCWIVSAATRHALGWWIWYRSQYEVRLQFQENEE